jgi:hypothetical protein
MTVPPFGSIAFLGSGETSYAGGRIFESLARNLPKPLRVSVLETPAGFELNSPQVAARVGDFIKTRLQNYSPQVDVIAARKRGTPFSPDERSVLEPLSIASLIFMGAGSPTYAVRQLKDSLAWHLLLARHRLGSTLVFASAAVISVSALTLPVYEIFKVGEDVSAKPGLDFFGSFGLKLSFIPHWNNAEGGDDVDTSRCFVGMDRFEEWSALMPADHVIVGLDEHTGLIWDMQAGQCRVSGVGSVAIIRDGREEVFPNGAAFDISALGACCTWPEPSDDIPAEVWDWARNAPQPEAGADQPPVEVIALADQRQQARTSKDFAAADEIRRKIAALGWTVQDTPEGPKLMRG